MSKWGQVYFRTCPLFRINPSSKKGTGSKMNLTPFISTFPGEEVTPQADGLDHRLGATGLEELAAQAADARVDRAVEPVVVDAAHHAQDLVARDDVALARGEQPQDVEVAGGELDRVLVDGGRAARAVDGEAAGGELGVA